MDEESGGSAGGGSSLKIRENVAGLLCYALGWVSGLVIYLLEKQSRFVRFHAVQSIVTFGILNLALLFLRRVPVVGWVLSTAGFVAWVVGMIRAYQGQMVKFPFAGDVAKRLAITD